jgi:hypothetical protein
MSNRLTCIDSKLSEMEILAQPLSLPFIMENLIYNNVFVIKSFKMPNFTNVELTDLWFSRTVREMATRSKHK